MARQTPVPPTPPVNHHRIGQTRKVQVHQFVCVGTPEECIDKPLTDKLLLSDQVVGSGDDLHTSLSIDRLRQYL